MLYRVLVSAQTDHWEYVEVEADDAQTAGRLACEKFQLDRASTSEVHELVVEAVELLDTRPGPDSDEVWDHIERIR